MCIGMPPFGQAFAGDDPMVLMLKELSVIGTLTGSIKDTHEARKFAARGLLTQGTRSTVYPTFHTQSASSDGAK